MVSGEVALDRTCGLWGISTGIGCVSAGRVFSCCLISPAPGAAFYMFAEAAPSGALIIQLCKWHVGEAVNWERLGSCLC